MENTYLVQGRGGCLLTAENAGSRRLVTIQFIHVSSSLIFREYLMYNTSIYSTRLIFFQEMGECDKCVSIYKCFFDDESNSMVPVYIGNV